jgi:cysteine desulfurase
VCVSSGSACSAGTTEASTVITAMVGRERAKAAVRISLGETTILADIQAVKEALGSVLGLLPANLSGNG